MKSLVHRAKNFLIGFFTRTVPTVVSIGAMIVSYAGIWYATVKLVDVIFVSVLTALGVAMPLTGFAGFLAVILFVISVWKLASWVLRLQVVHDYFEFLRTFTMPRARTYTYDY